MFDTEIPWTEEAKYLGITLDARLSWDSHINQQISKASAILSNLYPMFAKNSKLSIDNKLLLYKTSIRPIMTYASPVWARLSKTKYSGQ
jgi:hypothetical protein